MNSISGLTNYLGYNNVYGYDTSDTTAATSASELQNTLGSTDFSVATDDELMSVCKSFESYFVEQVMKEAKKMVKSEEEEGTYMQYFGDTLLQEYSDMITDRGDIGIAQKLYDSIRRNQGLL